MIDRIALLDNKRKCINSANIGNKEAMPLGFTNSLFKNAIETRPYSGLGKLFEAFVIPEKCPTIEVKDYLDVTE